LEEAGADVVIAREAPDALAQVRSTTFSAAVVDWRPGSDQHRRIARALKRGGVPFLFHATQALEDVTTVRGAPIVFKPASPMQIVKVLAHVIRSAS
jgi:DNA-binding response OmpR family regulator